MQNSCKTYVHITKTKVSNTNINKLKIKIFYTIEKLQSYGKHLFSYSITSATQLKLWALKTSQQYHSRDELSLLRLCHRELNCIAKLSFFSLMGNIYNRYCLRIFLILRAKNLQSYDSGKMQELNHVNLTLNLHLA